jgi:hypothetical protein
MWDKMQDEKTLYTLEQSGLESPFYIVNRPEFVYTAAAQSINVPIASAFGIVFLNNFLPRGTTVTIDDLTTFEVTPFQAIAHFIKYRITINIPASLLNNAPTVYTDFVSPREHISFAVYKAFSQNYFSFSKASPVSEMDLQVTTSAGAGALIDKVTIYPTANNVLIIPRRIAGATTGLNCCVYTQYDIPLFYYRALTGYIEPIILTNCDQFDLLQDGGAPNEFRYIIRQF